MTDFKKTEPDNNQADVWLEKARKGDEKAFASLVESYSGRIYNVCFNYLGNRQDAEDCTQETFIKVYRAIADFDYRASFYTWIYRIAANTCHDFCRKNRKAIVHSLDEGLETEKSQVYMQISDQAPLPDEQAEQSELCRLVRQEISGLPENLRDILVLRDLEGLSYQELARVLDISEGTVKSRLSRARRQLMQNLSRREHTVPI